MRKPDTAERIEARLDDLKIDVWSEDYVMGWNDAIDEVKNIINDEAASERMRSYLRGDADVSKGKDGEHHDEEDAE